MTERRGGGEKNKTGELLKIPDKAFFYGGMATYLLLGIPVALSIAAVAGATWAGSELVEKRVL
jgi:hypothetical protein